MNILQMMACRQHLCKEDGTSTIESVALLCVVVVMISIILNVFHSGSSTGQGFQVESGKERIQRAIDGGLASQIDRYKLKRTDPPSFWDQLLGTGSILIQEHPLVKEKLELVCGSNVPLTEEHQDNLRRNGVRCP